MFSAAACAGAVALFMAQLISSNSSSGLVVGQASRLSAGRPAPGHGGAGGTPWAAGETPAPLCRWSAYRLQFVCGRRGPADHLHHAGHADVAVADRRASAAADAGHREFPLDEIVRQLAEEAAVAAVVDGAARIMAGRHARETAQCAGVPDPYPLELVRAPLPVAHGETCAGRADISAAVGKE